MIAILIYCKLITSDDMTVVADGDDLPNRRRKHMQAVAAHSRKKFKERLLEQARYLF